MIDVVITAVTGFIFFAALQIAFLTLVFLGILIIAEAKNSTKQGGE